IVGGTTAPTSLSTNAGGTTQINTTAITTTGAQNYADNVVLGADATLAGGSVSFGGTVNSDATARALTVNSGGATTFSGAVGGGAALSTLTTNAAGTTTISGGAVTTSGGQSYGDK